MSSPYILPHAVDLSAYCIIMDYNIRHHYALLSIITHYYGLLWIIILIHEEIECCNKEMHHFNNIFIALFLTNGIER